MTRRAKEKRAARMAMKLNSSENNSDEEETISIREEAEQQWSELLLQLDQEERVEPRILVWKTTNVPVAAAGTFYLPIQVDVEQAKLFYQFHTKMYDICFAISRTMTNGTERYLLEPTRFDSHLEAVTGSLLIEGPCLLQLSWDNEYSWINSKDLAYSVELHTNLDAAKVESTHSKEWRILQAMNDRIEAVYQGGQSVRNLSNTVDSLSCTISDVEHRIEMMQQECQAAKEKRETIILEQRRLKDQIQIWEWEIKALGWMSMDTATVSRIFAFGTREDCAQWARINRAWSDAHAVAFHTDRSDHARLQSDENSTTN